ncbi:hypothetical protein ACFL6W_05405 [Thermodesulfobacteriota bacterium]
MNELVVSRLRYPPALKLWWTGSFGGQGGQKTDDPPSHKASAIAFSYGATRRRGRQKAVKAEALAKGGPRNPQ